MDLICNPCHKRHDGILSVRLTESRKLLDRVDLQAQGIESVSKNERDQK